MRVRRWGVVRGAAPTAVPPHRGRPARTAPRKSRQAPAPSRPRASRAAASRPKTLETELPTPRQPGSLVDAPPGWPAAIRRLRSRQHQGRLRASCCHWPHGRGRNFRWGYSQAAGFSIASRSSRGLAATTRRAPSDNGTIGQHVPVARPYQVNAPDEGRRPMGLRGDLAFHRHHRVGQVPVIGRGDRTTAGEGEPQFTTADRPPVAPHQYRRPTSSRNGQQRVGLGNLYHVPV